MNTRAPERTADIGGWKITLRRRDDPALPWHVEASDWLWGKHAEAAGLDYSDALNKIASKTGIDRDELLDSFGVHEH